MSGLVALCGFALLAEHLFDLAPFTGDHLVAGVTLCPVTSKPNLTDASGLPQPRASTNLKFKV
jgi:hypothetical protein